MLGRKWEEEGPAAGGGGVQIGSDPEQPAVGFRRRQRRLVADGRPLWLCVSYSPRCGGAGVAVSGGEGEGEGRPPLT